jgi:hypothetical protein
MPGQVVVLVCYILQKTGLHHEAYRFGGITNDECVHRIRITSLQSTDSACCAEACNGPALPREKRRSYTP